MTKIKLGTTALNMTYSDDELGEKILNYVKAQDDGVGFRDICAYLLTQAQAEKRIEGPADEEYQWESLSHIDTIRVDRTLWQLIWKHKLVIDFDSSHYPTQDIYFLSA
ncbi:MAG: hypothetical protein NC127_06570 [Muribaculum sp.]|nr:hypothetical protein [Muribaculum sp.]